jgi:zinc transporter ZupT
MTGASPTVGAVFFMTLLMAAASGLGAVPFFFVRRLSPRLAALANALACGVMLAASFDLVHEGEPHGAILVVVGVCFGAVFIALTQRALRDQEDVKFGLLRGADARKTLLMVGIMTAHS